ncbi:LINE-1 retrotransposable element ORF2 protein [Vitis vinifera]|uniref:LINE-1 retrotransposable element ORF2 protein n=1 Tax=Vitis vinifera TaxID=29760 RepID=A0A438JVA3_VITVI|nr:LINE-1 retrotransposable element ORF2 protein [Vitis vinifera]
MEGFLGRVGSDPRGSAVMVKPSSPETRGNDAFEGQIPVDIPNLEMEVIQPACPYQMFESVNSLLANLRSPIKESSKATVNLGGIAGSPLGEFQIEGLSPRKMAKVREVLKNLDIKGQRVSHEDNQLEYQGLGSKKKRRVVKDFLRSEKPDVVMIQETKKECDRREEVVLGSFSVSIKFALDGCESLWLSAVYGPNNSTLRKDFWVELSDIVGLAYPRWCVGGDFNVIRRSSKKLGGSRLTPSMKDFDDFIRDCELIDLPLRSASFTWSNMQENPVCKRLDCFLYSNEWEQVFPQSLQGVLPRWTSDHWPIVLETNPFKWGPMPFRFENMWLQHPNFKESFGRWWREFQGNGWEGHKFMRKLQFVKDKLKEWNKASFGELKSIKEEILRLESPFTEEEIFKAIFQMDRDKASGPDGFTIAVFQDCWEVIKEDLVKVFAEFHRSGIINQSTNASFIVLLPKKSMSRRSSDFRPISLITSLYKIIAKVLVGRLRGVLHETIHSTQGAFVQGRQILDAVLIANEIVDEKRRSGEEGIVFKIDFEKAYDHVILVNGNAKGWVKASRGLRQDDPLSPFLFTIVADVLSRMLLKAEERNVLEGFRVGRNRIRVSHLQFADDTIFFSSTREEDMMTLKNVLLVFEHISGLKVNLDKSNIYGINLEQNHLSRLAEMLDCKAFGWPMLYLGLPLGGNPKACGFWNPVIKRISRRLDGWQKAYLSFGGRITLIQSCLTHMPCYFLSLFKIPSSVATKIERMQRDFLWSGIGEGKRDHLVNWDIVCKPKSRGGLGFGKISIRNVALLGKWLWRYPREGSTLWHQVILSIYGSHSNGWDVNNIVRWSHRCPWKAIALVFQEFSKFTWFVVGLFTVKSFFLALSQYSESPPVFPTKFVWNSQVPFKVKSFVWLVAHKKGSPLLEQGRETLLKIFRSLFRSKPPYPLHLQALSFHEDAPKIFPPPPPPNHLELLKNKGSNPPRPRIPNIRHPSFLFSRQGKEGRKRLTQGGIPTPSIPPKAHPPPTSNFKKDSSAHQLPIHPYSFPKPHIVCLSHFP